MASPFSIFRKHERVAMAIVCVLAMFAFVFMDPIFGTRRGGGPKDPVAAETKLYGDIHESDLCADAPHGRGRISSSPRRCSRAGGFPNGRRLARSRNSLSSKPCCSRKAEQMGMRITDDEITQFLDDIGGNRLTSEDFTKILRSVSGGKKGQLTRRQVYDALRPELLARRFSSVFASDAAQTTPAERWESYQKLNNRARIEAIPVAVAEFVDKVPDPDDKTLQDFFDRYKQFEPMPGSPVPGFKIPAKVAVQYFEAEYDKFYHPDAVTEQEIEDEYNKNKDTRYLKSVDFGPSPGGDIEGDGETPAPQGTDETSPVEGAETPKDGAAAEKPAASQPDATSEAPAEQKPGNPPAKQAAPDSSPKQSLNHHGPDGTELALADPVRLAQATRGKGSRPAGKQKAPPSTPPSETAPAAAPAKPDETQTDVPAGEDANQDNPAPDASAVPEPAAGVPSDESPGEETKSEESSTDVTATKYDPLSKVEPAIRKLLAGEKAVEQMKVVLTSMRDKMLKYGNDWSRWDARHEHDPTLQPPKPLDFDALAAEHKLVTHTTKLLSARADGRGGHRQIVRRRDAPGQLCLRFVAALSSDWLERRRRKPVPRLEDRAAAGTSAPIGRSARRRRAPWKVLEARKPALARANALAETARKDTLTLAELAERDELPIEKPEPFSWLTYGAMSAMNTRIPPRLSEVKGIEDGGDDFMRVVFRQPEKGVAVAFNNPQTICYVIQVSEFEPGTEVLRRSFLADDYRTYARVLQPQQQRNINEWNRMIQVEAGLKWLRQPDPRRGEAEGESGG